MNDRELLELAAKAGGYEIGGYKNMDLGYWIPEEGCIRNWNPLTNDGDAFRLAVNLGIAITPYPIYAHPKHSVITKQYRMKDSMREPNPTETVEIYGDDSYAATRLAIVRTAAEIEKEKRTKSGPQASDLSRFQPKTD